MAPQPAAETKTTIDTLIETLKSKGKTDLATLASELNTDTGVVENWAKILEKGGMVKISYEVGKMFVSPLNITPEQEKSIKTDVQLKAAALQETAASQLISLQNLENNLRSMQGAIAEAEKVEAEELPEMKKAIGALNSIYSSIEHNSKVIEGLYKKLESEYDSANKRAEDLSAKIASINNLTSPDAVASDEIRVKMAELQKSVTSINNELALVSRNAYGSIDQLKKNVREQAKAIEDEIEQSKRSLNDKIKEYQKGANDIESKLKERLRVLESISQEAKAQAKEKEESIREVKRLRDEFNNTYLKSVEKIKQQNAEARSISDNLMSTIKSIKGRFGAAPEIDEELANTKKELSEIERGIEEARKELERIQAELKGVIAMSKLTAEQRSSIIQSLQKKTEKNMTKISGMKKRLDKASDSARNIGKPKKK